MKTQALRFIAMGFRAHLVASAAYAGAVALPDPHMQEPEIQHQVCQDPRSHPAQRRTTLAAGGDSWEPRLWLREAAQHVLAAAFQPARCFGEHIPAPCTHILLMILMKMLQSWSCDRSLRGSVQTFVLFT